MAISNRILALVLLTRFGMKVHVIDIACIGQIDPFDKNSVSTRTLYSQQTLYIGYLEDTKHNL